MNNRESLSHLVEIQYLLREKDSLIIKIAEENARISALNMHQEEAELRIKNLEAELKNMALKEKELSLSSIEANIDKLKNQLNMATNDKEANGLSDTLKNAQNNKDQLETLVFELLEKEESIKNEIHDLNNFLLGLQDTKLEIGEEVNRIIAEEKIKLQNNEGRLESLKVNLSKNELLMFERAYIKYPKNPLSYILSGLTCKECHMQLNSVLKTQVENMSSIEPCPYCERILLPANLNY